MNSFVSFWLIIAAILAVIIIVFSRTLLRRNWFENTRMDASNALKAAQIEELDATLSQGQISPDEAHEMRKEIDRAHSRATRRGEDGELTEGPKSLALILLAAMLVFSVLGYAYVGVPGLPDWGAQKVAELKRPSQEKFIELLIKDGQLQPTTQLDSASQELLDQLKDKIEENPKIAEGYTHLHTLERARNNIVGAYQAQEKYIELKGDEATASDFATLAEDMILATNGYVSPQAETALRESLTRDGNNQVAQFYMAVTMKQEGALEQAREVFVALESKVADRPEWLGEIKRLVAEIDNNLPATKGPTSAQIQDAENMSDEDRQAMIGGMVDGLKARLGETGGEPEEWARLISSLRVLERNDEADAILGEALNKFPDNTQIQALK